MLQGGRSVGHHPPGTAAPDDVEDAVEDLAEVDRAGPAPGLGRGSRTLSRFHWVSSQIGGVAFGFHTGILHGRGPAQHGGPPARPGLHRGSGDRIRSGPAPSGRRPARSRSVGPAGMGRSQHRRRAPGGRRAIPVVRWFPWSPSLGREVVFSRSRRFNSRRHRRKLQSLSPSRSQKAWTDRPLRLWCRMITRQSFSLAGSHDGGVLPA